MKHDHHCSTPDVDRLAIDTIRTLSMDAVQKANSGHPGTPMALAPVIVHAVAGRRCATTPSDPHWPDRDRFVLSCGHASMLLYSMLHLAGVQQVDAHGETTGKLAVPLEEIERFRQLDSRVPGHPEYGWTTRRRDDDRAARPGRRQLGRHGDRAALARGALQQAGLRALHAHACARSAATAT